MLRPRTPMQRRYGTHLTTTNIRRVWAAISATPHASKRELAHALRLSYGATAGALRMLKGAGYIAFEPGSKRAVTILVPYIRVKKASR
jgi:hypothetical protein